MGDGRPLTGPARRRDGVPAALAAAGLVALYAALLVPGRVLFGRDVATFHLPLRGDLVRLAAAGELPAWDPWIHGGQPLLSNPSYAAFYPPTWLAAAVGPAASLGLLVLLHGALAALGSWRLARRLGAGPAAAAVAVLGFAGGGALLSLVDALTLFFGAAWLPWVLLAGEATLAGGAGRWQRPAAGGAAALAMMLANGEPATVACALLALGALAADEALRRRREARRGGAVDGPVADPAAGGDLRQRRRTGAPAPGGALAVPLRLAVLPLVAVALAAVQVVPAAARVAESPRAGGLGAAAAGQWSAPPVRLAELVLPRVTGDPSRAAEGLWFGVGIHDRDVPYVAALYPGLLVSVLGLAGLFAGVPRRWAWAVLAVAGVALGLGRHLPLLGTLLGPLHARLPFLDSIRYPEKFLLLLVALALPFAAALAWQRLSGTESAAGLRRAAVALAVAAALAGGALAAATVLAPEAAAARVRRHVPPQLTDFGVARGVDYLRGQALRSAAVALAVAGLAALAGRHRAIALLAPLLLAADLVATHGGVVRTVPAAELTRPPPLAGEIAAAGGRRLFSDTLFVHERAVVVPDDEPQLAGLRDQVANLAPYSATLWGLGYALDDDYELMRSRWAEHAVAVATEARRRPDGLAAVLAGWSVDAAILTRPLAERVPELAAGRPSPAVARAPVPGRLPRFRGVPAVRFVPDAAAARTALARQGWRVGERDVWIAGEGAPPAATGGGTGGEGGDEAGEEAGGAARVLAARAGGRRIVLDAAAPPGGGWLVAAVTFDRGWRATAGGRGLPLWPTALGQIGTRVPAGRHRVELVYRDRRLPWGVAGSAAGLLALAALAAWPRLRHRGLPPSPG